MTSGTDTLIRYNLLQIAAGLPCTFLRDNLTDNLRLGNRCFPGIRIGHFLDDMRNHQLAAIGDGSYCCKLFDWRNLHLPVSVSKCGEFNGVLRCYPACNFSRKINASLLFKPEIMDILCQPVLSQHLIAQFYKSNVAGALHTFKKCNLSPSGADDIMERLARTLDPNGA
ncbi:hypothetical protein D3C75_791130 [compost metagenome]